MSREETIDLNKLTTKELMIRLFDRINHVDKEIAELKEDLNKNDENYRDLLTKVVTMETKMKTWGALFGLGAALAFEIIIQILNYGAK